MSTMKIYTKISLFLLISLLAGLSSCIEDEQYPLVPRIEYSGFSTIRDVAGKDSIGKITISYTDGDGNLGYLNDADTIGPHKYNFYLNFLEQVNGKLQPVQMPDPNITFNARFPYLAPEGRNKNIKGDITMQLDLYLARQALLSDTIAFQIYIMDQALNKSNVIDTPRYKIKK